jgi:hypothetical protein
VAAVARGEHWAVAVSVVAGLLVAGCSGATSPTGATTTAETTASTTGATTTSATPTISVTEPESLFPSQAALPVMVYVDGVVYDLAEVPVRKVVDLGRSDPFQAAPPIATQYGLLVATGAYYHATLTLYPTDGGDPRVLAQGVGSFALSADGSHLAWAEPFKGPSGNADETTRLAEAQFPSGEVIHSTTFLGFDLLDLPTTWGFADVIAYVGDNVLLMTGDGAGAAAAVWMPAEDSVAVMLDYSTVVTGNSRDGRVVVSQGDGACAEIVSIAADGAVLPIGGLGSGADVGCWASSAATFSPDGVTIASAGTDGELGPPLLLLTSSADGRELARVIVMGTSEGSFLVSAIEWLDDHSLVILASEGPNPPPDQQWSIFRCDTQALTCDLAQPIAFDPTGFNQVALVEGA